jgi:hypothetical protein
MIDKLLKLLPKSPAADKLVRWALSKNQFTDPQERHTSQQVAEELSAGLRLVGNPWKEDVDQNDFTGHHVVDYGKQLMVALPENADVLELVTEIKGPASHIVRGLAFGYNPTAVFQFYQRANDDERWAELLRDLGVKLSSDYPPGGYSSVWRGETGNVIVDPGDIDTIKPLYDEFDLISIVRWCPECQNYINVKNAEGDGADHCPHQPTHTPQNHPNTRHWFDFRFQRK